MPKGKYQRKTRMQADEGAAPVAAPEAPPQAPAFEGQVTNLLIEMSATLKSLSERVEKVETSGPRFVPASVETYGAAHERHDVASKAPADGIPRSQTIPIFSNGDKVPDFVLGQYPARFGAGSRVQLNPDAVPHGRSDGKTRGELKADDGTPWGVGEVIDRKFLTKGGTWKYRVRFPSRVVTGSNGGMTAMHEPELLPA